MVMLSLGLLVPGFWQPLRTRCVPGSLELVFVEFLEAIQTAVFDVDCSMVYSMVYYIL